MKELEIEIKEDEEKGDKIEEKIKIMRKDKNRNTSIVAKGALAHRLQCRTACKIQNGRQGAPKWLTGSGKVSTPRFLGILSNFC